jgi:hypothetical protein
MKKHIMQTTTLRKLRVVILILQRQILKQKMLLEIKRGTFYNYKGICQKDITILSIYALNSKGKKYEKEKLTEM